LLLLLVVLGAAGRALSAASIFGCLRAALRDAHRIRHGHGDDHNAALDKRGSEWPVPEDGEEEEEEEQLGKRTFPEEGHLKHAPQAKGRSSPSRAKSDRRTKVTLSLDVPTNIMNILFNIAKAKNLRAKAAANAHLMAQIGRRK
ncbi:UCN3 protein, partial [Bombycilla garrulus]|nr:UCN3 protein [Bombycilla garrulus]